MTPIQKTIDLDLLIGLGELERQHETANRLMARIDVLCRWPGFARCRCSDAERKDCSVAFDHILADALIFMVEHFRYEEGLMKTFAVDLQRREDIARHKEAHGCLSADLLVIATSVQDGELKAPMQRFTKLLETYLEDHHRHDDMAFVQWLAEKEPTVPSVRLSVAG